MNTSRLLTSGACTVLAIALAQTIHPTASACVGAPCSATRSLPSEGSIPANAVEFVARMSRSPSDDASVPAPRLYVLEGGASRELETSYEVRDGLLHVRPKASVAANSELRLQLQDSCTSPAPVAKNVRVAQAASIPLSLGTLRAEVLQGPVRVTVGSRCYEDLQSAYADLTVDLSVEAQPYDDVLRYQLEVDGKPWTSYGYHSNPPIDPRLGTSMLGPGKDRIYAACEDYLGQRPTGSIGEGRHRVQVVGLLADDTRVPSNEVEIELRCPVRPDAGASDASVSDAGAGDAGLVVAADSSAPTSAVDAAASPTMGADAGPALSSDDGCSVGAGAAGFGSGAWALLLALGSMLVRRRTAR